MNERRYVSKGRIERMASGTIALELIDDCYKEDKPSNESKSDFLNKVSLLRDKVGSKC